MAFVRSTPYFEITFWLVQDIKYKIQIHDIELFITYLGLSMICAYLAKNVRKYISQHVELVLSSFCQFVQRALKCPVTIEQRGNLSFIWLRRISKFVQKISNSPWL